MNGFNKLHVALLMAAKTEGADTSMVTGDNTAKIIEFNPLGIVTPNYLDALKPATTEVEKAEFETQYSLIAAREFDAAYTRTADVLDAAEEARDRLSSIPLGIARYCQGFFSKTEAGKKVRLQKYAKMCQISGEELAKRHEKSRGGDSYTVMMQNFKVGRMWLKLTQEARGAIKWDINLNAKRAGTEDALYTNTRQVATTAQSMSQKAQSAKAAKTAGATEGTGTGDGGILGDGKADVQSLKLNEKLPTMVQAQLLKVVSAVNSLQYEKDQKAAKRSDSNTVLTSRVLAHTIALLGYIAKNTLDAFDMGILAQDTFKLLNEGTIPERTAGTEIDDEETVESAEPTDEDETEDTELPTVEVEHHDDERTVNE